MKKVGAILLVAGTCIGSGMIALPLVLSKLGLIPSVALMILIWYVAYYTSLISLELNLQAGKGLTLGELGRFYSGRAAEWIGVGSLKILSYSLLAVYMYGGSSIVQELLTIKTDINYSIATIASWFALFSAMLLLLPLRFIDYCNRVLFVALLSVVLVLIIGLTLSVDWNHLPLFSPQAANLSSWSAVIPVVFTSFGFQVIFHTLANYCKQDAKMLKQVFFWGSFIPAVIYIIWTCSILSVVYHENLGFYKLMSSGNAEVGELVEVLSRIARWQAVQFLVWLISLLAIITSVIGVGIGLLESLKKMLEQAVQFNFARTLIASIATIAPAYLLVLLIPNAFIAVLAFAGLILTIIAILLPAYLFYKIEGAPLHYEELKKKGFIFFSILIALIVIAAEIYTAST